MTYEEQLNSLEWKNKRDIILERDGYKCQNCLNKIYIEKYSLAILMGSPDKQKRAFSFQDFITFETNIATYSSDIVIIEKGDFNLISNNNNHNYLVGVLDLKAETVKSWTGSLDDDYTLFKLFHTNWTKEAILNSLNSINWKYLQNLHIHHKYYQINKNAWEYPDDALQTLCWECHENLHKNINIKVMDENGVFIGERIVCDRCYGAGRFPEFGHVQGGICFKCNGARFQ